jgi:hypothetical protein
MLEQSHTFTLIVLNTPVFLYEHTQNYSKAERSNGTVLPLPARYILVAPENSRGLGSVASGWNLNRVSSIVMRPPPILLPPVPCDRLGDFAPLLNVYDEASIVDREMDPA